MTFRIINPIDWLLRIAARIAVRRWNDPKRIPDGIPGIRDSQNPCRCYSPRTRLHVLAAPALGCNGDGHYLCDDCRWLCKEEEL